jgi:hypothetical protein
MEAKVYFQYWPTVQEVEIIDNDKDGNIKANYSIKFDYIEERLNRTITEAENYLKEVIANAST